MTPGGRPRAPRGVRKHAPRRVDPGTLEKHAPLGLRGPSIVRSARHKAPRASWTGGTRRGNSARARKRASGSIMARGVSRFRRHCRSRFPHDIFATEKRAAKTVRARAEPREPAARLSDGGEAPAVALTGARACCSYRRRESARVVRIDIKRKRSRSFQSRRRVARPASSRSSRSPPKRILSTPHASDALMSLRCEP